MQMIAIAATKGGTSKSTLAASLLVEASRHVKRAALIDLDPQQSLATWHGMRSTPDTELVPTGAKMGSALDKVRARAEPPDIVIVDTPPGLMRFAEMAIEKADLVLVPCRASPLDVQAVDIMRELCETAGKPYVFVLTMVNLKREMMTAGARDFLKDKGPVLDVVMTDRESYPKAMLGGRTGPEIDKAAKAEIAALWVAIRKQLAAKKRASK